MVLDTSLLNTQHYKVTYQCFAIVSISGYFYLKSGFNQQPLNDFTWKFFNQTHISVTPCFLLDASADEDNCATILIKNERYELTKPSKKKIF